MSTNNPTLTFLEHHNQLTDAIARSESLPRHVRTLLIGISTFFNHQKQCAFPNRKQLSARTGYCVNHITDLIKEAVELGVLKSTAQFVQIDGESAPRQIANKYEFVLEKFGLFYNKTKALLNRNLRKKNKESKEAQEASTARVDHINQLLEQAVTPELSDTQEPTWEDYSPPE